MFRRMLAILVFAGTFVQACSLRLDWPDHKVRVRLAALDADLPFALGIQAISLKPCDTWALWDLPEDLLVPSAFAHSTPSPDYIELNLVYSGGSQELGVMQPFEGQYCAVVVHVAPLAALDGKSLELSSYALVDTRKIDLEIALDDPSFAGTDRQLDVVLTLDPAQWVRPEDMTSGDPTQKIVSRIRSSARWDVHPR